MIEIVKLLDKRLDRIESKVDHLIAFKWKSIGALTVMCMLLTAALHFVQLIPK